MSEENTNLTEQKPSESLASQLATYAPNTVADREDYINVVLKSITAGAQKLGHTPTKGEITYFLQVASTSGLNPLTKQIYAIYRRVQGAPTLTIQAGIDGMRSTAEQTGFYAGSDDGVFEYDDNKKLVKACVTVYKVNKITGERMPTTASALWSNYAPKKMDSNAAMFWRDMPEVMLEKCAEAKALRKAFPNTGQIYTPEELQNEMGDKTVNVQADRTVVNEQIKAAKAKRLQEQAQL